MTDITGPAVPDDIDEPDNHGNGASGDKKPSRSRSAKLFVRDVVLILLAAILISFLIKTFLIRSFYIPSESMMDTLQVHDRVIVNELEPKLISIKHGDIIVFKDPGGWLPASPPDLRNPVQKGVGAALGFVGLSATDSNDHLIKRVIGLPGDHVTCCGNFGSIRVNDVPLDEPYIDPVSGKSAPSDFDITVPKGMLWVMGDNRGNSEDSLAHHREGDPGGGFLPISDVVGRAFVISWPAARWTWLDNYPATFRGVDDDKSGSEKSSSGSTGAGK